MSALRRLRRLARGGFSLVELLIVIAVFGILVAIVTPTYLALRARAQVVEAVQQVARDVERARLDARRLNAPSTIDLDLVGGGTEYDWVDAAGTRRTISLPQGTRFAADSDDAVEFLAPYGTVVPTGDGVLVIGVEWSSGQFAVERELRVVGVMGKVVVQ